MMKSNSISEGSSLKLISLLSTSEQTQQKNFSSLLMFEEKNQTKELFHAVMSFKNPKNLKQISEDPAKEQIINEVLRICNKLSMEMMEEGLKNSSFSSNIQEIFDLVSTLRKISDSQDSKTINLEVSFFNNYGTFFIISKNFSRAKESLKSAEKLLQKTNKLSLWGLTYNNLASISFLSHEYFMSYKYAEQSLYKLEPTFFQRIKETSKPEKAKLIPEFMTDLILVLIGYMYLSTSLEYLHKNQTLIPKFEKITSKTSKLFYQNGHKLAQKYLNEDHYLTKKFHNLLSHGIEGIESYIKPFGVGPQILQDSEETNVKNSFFLNPIESSFDRNSNNDDFFNKKQGKAFRLQTRKIFPNDIRAKSLNKLHSNEEDEEELESENYQIPYSALKSNKNSNKQNNPIYKRQMKEIEKTIKEMKKLKDKYQKNESTFFLQKNFELLLQQKELEDFISKRRDLQSSVIYPNTSQMFYMPQQQSNPVYAGLNKGQIDPTELLLQKQKEMEITLTNLQKEHFKILQDKEDKDKELDKLKNYVLKLEAEKISKELEKKIKNANNSKETKSVKVMNNELNIAPASSFNNLNESNLSDNSNKAKGRYSNPGDRKFKIPLDNVNKEKRKSIERNNEIKKEFTPTNSDNQESHLKRSHMMNNNNSNKINPSLTNLKKASSTSIKEEKGTTVLEKMIQEKVIQDKTKFEEKKTAPEKPKIRNQPSVTKLDRSNIQEKHILSDDKKPMEGNNDTDTITNQKPLNKRSESVRKILTEFKTSSLRQLNSDSLKKQDSLTSMDLALETINPSHLLRTILSSNHKSVIVRKKAFIDGKVFNFEFHILQENDTYIFKILCFYESNGKPAIKEELLQINLIRKILQNIDYRDVIPFIYPLKTIYNVLKFSRYFILPFLGIGDNKSVLSAEENNEKKVEIWPKAHGLIDKNIKVIFMGEEFFIFFHFLANDTFRLILSNAKNGMTFRIEYQFDPGSLKKFFELLENNKPTIDENHDMYHVIEILEDEDIKDHMIKDAQNLISKYCQTSPEAEYFIENFRILDVNVFIAFLEKTVKEFEELLKTKGFSTLRPLLSEDGTKVFKIKIWNEGNRYRFSMILENFEKKEFEILLKNNFETHAPMKKTVKAMGSVNYSFESLWKHFGLVYNKLDSSDKILISSIILDSYTLEIHEKVLDKDDYESYEENPIIQMSLECGGFYRTYIGNAYKYPLTMSLIGYQGIPIGVKAVIFDPVECKENGMFFTVNPEAWRKKGNEITKKKSYKYVSVIPLEADFYLHYVLEKVGYKVLLNSIQVEKGNGGCDNLGKCLIKGSLSIVDNIENLINIINVLEVYRNE